MKIEFFGYTSPGLVRRINQDSVFAEAKDEYGLFAVADGMGGHFKGEVASGRLTDALKSWWNGFAGDLYDYGTCYDDLRQIMYDVNESIYNEFSSQGNICGTTVGLMFIYKDKYIIINSGDTRIYSRHGFRVSCESRDHIFAREAVISGACTKEEAVMSPDKNKLTAAVGSKKELKMYISSAPLKSGSFLICSDGVYKYCSALDIRAALSKKNTPEFIKGKIEKNGAGDNYSFIMIRCTQA